MGILIVYYFIAMSFAFGDKNIIILDYKKIDQTSGLEIKIK